MCKIASLSALVFCFCVTPSLLVAQETTFGPDTLNGEWVLREPDDEDVEGFMTISGGSLSVTDATSGETEATLASVSNDGPLYFFSATIDGKTVNLHAYAQSTSRLLLWVEEDDVLMMARRLGEVPAQFFGEWQAVMADGDAAEFRKVVVEPGFVTLYGEGISEWRTPLYAMVDDGRELEIAFARGPGEGPRAFLVQQVTEHACLVWEADDDDAIIIYRIGQRPDWAPEVPVGTTDSTIQVEESR